MKEKSEIFYALPATFYPLVMIQLEIITPDKTVFAGAVDSVSMPTAVGEITVLRSHIPLITIVEPGSLVARQGKTEHLFAVSRGTIEVDGIAVRVLVRSADSADDLADEDAIEKARASAERLMKEKRQDSEAFAEATAVLDRELARLRTTRRRGTRRSPSPRIDQ